VLRRNLKGDLIPKRSCNTFDHKARTWWWKRFFFFERRRAYNKILERVCLCDAAAAGDLSFFFFCFRLGSSIFKFAFEIFFLFPFSFQPNDVAKKIASLGIVLLLLLLSYRD
jgi:hypothetical protein